MKHSWIMYAFVAIILVVLLTHGASAIGLTLAGGSATTGLVTALEGPPSTGGGTFSFGSNKVTLNN